MIKLWKGKWTLQDARDNPDKYFVFGDNDQRRGNGGQACIRPAKNSIGIRTKKYPSIDKGAFYTDNEFQENVRKIDEDINKILDIFDNVNRFFFYFFDIDIYIYKIIITIGKMFYYKDIPINQTFE